MNEQKFDELFRDKLENFSEIPSSGALAKLNRKLNERKRGAWLNFAKLAAVLIVIAISAYVADRWNNEPQNKQLAQVSVSDSIKRTTQQITAVKPSPEQPHELPIENPEAVVLNGDVDKKEEVVITKLPTEPGALLSQVIEKDHELLEEPSLEQSEISTDSASTGENLQPKRYKVTITYKKSPAPPEPMLALHTKSKENNKVLIKLLARAQSFHVSEFSLAGVRGAKDELLNIERRDKKARKSD